MTRAVLNQFASLTNPTLPNLDADFLGVANTLVVPCTASGTNAITLTPVASTVTVSAYTDKDQYTFVAAAGSTGAVTLQVSSLGLLNVYKAGGTTQAGSGDIVNGQFYQVAYQASLNAAAGGFVIVSAIIPPLNPAVLRGFIDGFETGAPGASQTLTIGPGACADNTNSFMMNVNSTYTKTLAGWAVGSGNGGLDTGSVATNTKYWLYVIQRPDTAVVDYAFSVSASSPTIGANIASAYTTIRGPVAFLRTDASGTGNILQYQQRNDTFLYGNAVADQNPATVTTSRSLLTVTVPSGFVVEALFRGTMQNASGGTNTIFTSPDENDQAASVPNVDLATNGAGQTASGSFARRTNTSAQIGARASAASTSVYVGTDGFIWTRGRNS